MKFITFILFILTSNFSFADTYSEEDIEYCKEVAIVQKKIECAEAGINICHIKAYFNGVRKGSISCGINGAGGGELKNEIFKSVITEYGLRKTACKNAVKKSKKEAKELCKNKYKSCYVITSGVSKFPKNNICEATTIIAGKSDKKR